MSGKRKSLLVSLDNQTCIVTGASRGISRGIATELGEYGASVVANCHERGWESAYRDPTREGQDDGPRAAVNILYRRELAAAEDTAAKREKLMAAYREEFANPYKPAEHGYIDDVIEPRNTRTRLIDDLYLLNRKRVDSPPKGHGNIPL